jgi:hypothetical protein
MLSIEDRILRLELLTDIVSLDNCQNHTKHDIVDKEDFDNYREAGYGREEAKKKCIIDFFERRNRKR